MASHPKTCFYFNTYTEPHSSVDLAQCKYLGSTKELQAMKPITGDVVLLFMSPSDDSIPEFKGYVTRARSGNDFPGTCLVPRVPPVEYLDAFDSFEMSLEWGVDLLTEDEEKEPEVNPMYAPVYAVPPEESVIYIGSDTDVIHVAKVQNVMHNIYVDVLAKVTEVRGLRYHEIQLYGSAKMYPPNSHPFDMGTTLVNWNARGMSRNSFLDHFLAVLRTHAPKIILITEARIDMDNLHYLAEKFSTNFDYDQFGNPAEGNVVLLWAKYDVNSLYALKTEHALHQLVGIMFEAVYQPPNQKRSLPPRRSRPPEAQEKDNYVPGEWVPDSCSD